MLLLAVWLAYKRKGMKNRRTKKQQNTQQQPKVQSQKRARLSDGFFLILAAAAPFQNFFIRSASNDSLK
jgi:hypothetical protein